MLIFVDLSYGQLIGLQCLSVMKIYWNLPQIFDHYLSWIFPSVKEFLSSLGFFCYFICSVNFYFNSIFQSSLLYRLLYFVIFSVCLVMGICVSDEFAIIFVYQSNSLPDLGKMKCKKLNDLLSSEVYHRISSVCKNIHVSDLIKTVYMFLKRKIYRIQKLSNKLLALTFFKRLALRKIIIRNVFIFSFTLLTCKMCNHPNFSINGGSILLPFHISRRPNLISITV